MASRLFWFAVGVGCTAYVVVKGREYQARLSPEGLTQQLSHGASSVAHRVSEFVDTFVEARNAREAELRAELGMGKPA